MPTFLERGGRRRAKVNYADNGALTPVQAVRPAQLDPERLHGLTAVRRCCINCSKATSMQLVSVLR